MHCVRLNPPRGIFCWEGQIVELEEQIDDMSQSPTGDFLLGRL